MTSYSTYSDFQIVAAINAESISAFEYVYWKYSKELSRFIKRNISIDEDCQEIIQEIFETLWNRRGDLQIENLTGYLFGMARYKVINYIRRNKVKRKYENHFKLFEEVYEYTRDREEEFDSSTLESLIEENISNLPSRCQDAFRLRMHENLSNNEIASRLNISQRTVENYMHRALAHLRATIAKPLHTKVISLLIILRVIFD